MSASKLKKILGKGHICVVKSNDIKIETFEILISLSHSPQLELCK